MTVKELSASIGKQGSLSVSGLHVEVKVTDARQVYGRHDLQVAPVNGSGEIWVEASRVHFEEQTF